MSSARFKNLIASARPRAPRVGQVVSVTLADSVCTVLINEGEVPAFLTDQVWSYVEVGAVVTILPVGDTYQVIGTQGSSAGAGGLLLGPELLPNGGFEYGPAGGWPDHWDGFTSTGPVVIARDTTPGESVSGDARLLMTMSPTTGPVDARAVVQSVSVDAGSTYQNSVWLKASSMTSNLQVKLIAASWKASDFSGTLTIVTIATVSLPGAAYQLVTGPITIPAGHDRANVLLEATADAGANLTVSWDEASLRQRIN